MVAEEWLDGAAIASRFGLYTNDDKDISILQDSGTAEVRRTCEIGMRAIATARSKSTIE